MPEYTTSYIQYKQGYLYQLATDLQLQIALVPEQNIDSKYISLTNSGYLTIKAGYAWDGASGPAIDTANFMRGSLVHDALYQLMRMGKLNGNKHRKTADLELKNICQKDGMSAVRAWWVYTAVRSFGKDSARPSSKKRLLRAPAP